MTRAEGFAAIPNWIVRDASVSPIAVAVYVALASHTGPGGIHPSQSTLAKEARCSERSVRNGLAELEALGVLERVRRTSREGRASNGYVLHPHGRLAADEVPAPDAVTGLEVPAPDAAGSGTRRPIAPITEEEPLKKNPGVLVDIPDGFDRFWRLWPRSTAKKAARAAWDRAVKRAGGDLPILEGVRRFLATSPDPRFVPYAATWLNGDRWEDELSSVTAAGGDGSLDLTTKWGAGNEWMEHAR